MDIMETQLVLKSAKSVQKAPYLRLVQLLVAAKDLIESILRQKASAYVKRATSQSMVPQETPTVSQTVLRSSTSDAKRTNLEILMAFAEMSLTALLLAVAMVRSRLTLEFVSASTTLLLILCATLSVKRKCPRFTSTQTASFRCTTLSQIKPHRLVSRTQQEM